MKRVIRPITILGHATIRGLEFLGGHGYLLRDTAVAIPNALIEKRGRRLGWTNLWAQMVRVGVKSIAIVSLVVFCIGAILALQMEPILRKYGASAQ
ncbi:MAG TPA: ABC transporter permease, partial [Tepidisphaeraceae bacterium]|nr:ABC transporter permease [Tepidisphaeraceae bacterium]